MAMNKIKFNSPVDVPELTIDNTTPKFIKSGSGANSEIFNNTNNSATGAYSHAEGTETVASGAAAHAEGGKYNNIKTTASA